MNDATRYHKPFEHLQVDRAILEIDDEVPPQYEEEFVVVIMLVPMIFALHDTQTDDRVVHFAQGLVVPAVFARGDQAKAHPLSRVART